MSVSERLALLDWANENEAVIIEDDFDSEFSYSGAPMPTRLFIILCKLPFLLQMIFQTTIQIYRKPIHG